MTNVAIMPAVFERPVTSNSESISKSRLRYQGCLVTSSSKNMTSRDVYHFCSSKVDCIHTVHQFQPGRFLVLLNDMFDVSQLIRNCDKDGPYSIKPFDKESYQAWILRYLYNSKIVHDRPYKRLYSGYVIYGIILKPGDQKAQLRTICDMICVPGFRSFFEAINDFVIN